MSMISSILESFLGKSRGHNEGSGQMQFDCPACSEEQGMPQGNGKGNLEVNYKKGYYHCWACGERNRMKGKITWLIKRYGNATHLRDFLIVKPEFKEKKISDGINKANLPQSFNLLIDKNKNKKGYNKAMHYLRSRGIEDDIITKYNMGWCNDGKYNNRIILPSYDSMGDLNFFVGRAFEKRIKPKILNEEVEKSLLIFNEKHINWDSTIYIVEGPFDHIITPNSIPLLGKILHNHLLNTILSKARANVVVLMDGDAYDDAINVYNKLNVDPLKGRVRIIQLNKEYDPSMVYEKFGRKNYIKVLRNTKTIPYINE